MVDEAVSYPVRVTADALLLESSAFSYSAARTIFHPTLHLDSVHFLYAKEVVSSSASGFCNDPSTCETFTQLITDFAIAVFSVDIPAYHAACEDALHPNAAVEPVAVSLFRFEVSDECFYVS